MQKEINLFPWFLEGMNKCHICKESNGEKRNKDKVLAFVGRRPRLKGICSSCEGQGLIKIEIDKIMERYVCSLRGIYE